MSIAHTRTIVRAILQGDLRGAATHVDPVFRLQIPNGVPERRARCSTRASWPDPEDYDRQAAKLRGMFDKNIGMIGKSASTAG
jgi:phosphoenolpyruvate carboxykinase (ATP)